MGRPQKNVMVIPFPAQGHVNCFMNFSHKLAQNGLNITFLNSDYNHKRIMERRMKDADDDEINERSPFKFVSIPDGMEREDDRNDIAKICLAMISTMRYELERFLEDNIIQNGDDRITCVVADAAMAWTLEVAYKLGIKSAVVCVASAALFALKLHAPKLIQDGLIDPHGII